MPLEDYYEKIDELVEPGKKEPETKKKPAIDFKLILYISILICIIIYLFYQFISTYMATIERSKLLKLLPITRVKMRMLGSELDHFFDKNKFYPTGLKRFQYSKKYFSLKYDEDKFYFTDATLPLDPYTSNKETFKYLLGPKSVGPFLKLNPREKVICDPYQFWMTYSVGPDKKDDLGAILYDPTNGTVSSGDIVEWSMRGRFMVIKYPGFSSSTTTEE